MTAVIYARYSSDNQREESIEGQIRECTAYAEKNGITVVKHYIDRALSAKTDNRPEFQQMIKDSEKRLFDIVGSALLLILLAIPMGIVALVIYLDDKGAPIFSQARLTKDGKVFYMHKFRSMCVDAEQKFAEVQKENETDGLAFKSENDPRITRIGHFIRRTSIDELPQLWDVFCGHMSIIGPRPPLPREVVLYTPHQMQRLQVKGGLSCICQVEGRSDMGFEKWVESDLEYIQTRSAGLDLKLVFKTIGAVIMKKGAR